MEQNLLLDLLSLQAKLNKVYILYMIMAIKNFENKKEEIIEKKINYIFEDE
jgi:hypothetical protein